MSRQPKVDVVELLMKANTDNVENMNKMIVALRQEQQVLAKATYSGLTGSGKARFVTKLVDAYGSQQQVAKTLDLTPGRISQLVNSEKNKQNGK